MRANPPPRRTELAWTPHSTTGDVVVIELERLTMLDPPMRPGMTRTLKLEADNSITVGIARVKARPARRLRDAMREYEREHIRSVLGEAERDRERAARLLGIGVSSLYRKMKELKIEND